MPTPSHFDLSDVKGGDLTTAKGQGHAYAKNGPVAESVQGFEVERRHQGAKLVDGCGVGFAGCDLPTFGGGFPCFLVPDALQDFPYRRGSGW